MDPVGPWSAYAASYNRLANASSFQNSGPSDFHPGGVQGASSSTSQLLAAHASSGIAAANSTASPFNPPGFLSPPPVGYDSVFTPLFHQKAHYGIQPRPLKQPDADPYCQTAPNSYYEQNNGPSIPWSQNSTAQMPSPFGILPHESVVNSSSSGPPKPFENAHLAAAQSLNTPLTDSKKRPSSPPKSITSAAPFFQQMFTPPSEAYTNAHFHPSKHYQNGTVQQNCNVASPPNSSNQSKDFRTNQISRSYVEKSLYPLKKGSKQLNPYDTEKKNETDSQSSPISYAMIDAQRGFQGAKLRPNIYQQLPGQQPYRYPMTPESDYQRSKSTESIGSLGSTDCTVGMPRRPSPLHPQSSPSVTGQSPNYPMYTSPLTNMSSPSPIQGEQACYNKHVEPPLDVTTSRTRQEYERHHWEERLRRYSMDPQSFPNKQCYEPNNQLCLQDLSKSDPMSLVKNIQQREKPAGVFKNVKRKKSSEKQSDVRGNSKSRIPPPAHHTNQPNQNGYVDYERWNLSSTAGKGQANPSAPQPPEGSTYLNQPASLVTAQMGPNLSYYSPCQQPQQPPPFVQGSNQNPEKKVRKVIVPNILEELKCLLDLKFADDRRLPTKLLKSHLGRTFLQSFEQFIKGEKESSPPPIQKREPSYYISNQTPLTDYPAVPEDDPRYFPLPKTSENRTFDSSESDYCDSEFPSRPTDTKSTNEKKKPKKEKKKKKKSKGKKSKKKPKKSRKPATPEPIPRRQLSRRSSVNKVKTYKIDDDEDEKLSENDLPWSAQEGSDDSEDEKRPRRSRRKRAMTNFKESSDDEEDIPMTERNPERIVTRISLSAIRAQSEESQEEPKSSPEPYIIAPKPNENSEFPFCLGDFVVLKTDKGLRHPPLWRLVEKTMLQKFLHFSDKGVSYYRNIKFCTGWNAAAKDNYEGVTVKVMSSRKHETVVELLAENLLTLPHEDRAVINSIVESSEKYRENVEVFVQTFYSKALEPNFLNEIFTESDDYFLDNVKIIDNLLLAYEERLVEGLNWSEDLVSAIRVHHSYKRFQRGVNFCSCCGDPSLQLITLAGLPYNRDNLEYDVLADPNATYDVFLCRECLNYFEVLHCICHFKYSVHIHCERIVSDKRKEDSERDNRMILNELLTDETLFQKTFRRFREEWGYYELMIQNLKKKPLPESKEEDK